MRTLMSVYNQAYFVLIFAVGQSSVKNRESRAPQNLAKEAILLWRNTVQRSHDTIQYDLIGVHEASCIVLHGSCRCTALLHACMHLYYNSMLVWMP